MTWTAPAVERSEPGNESDERASLLSWLTFYRETLLWKMAGLGAEQLREQSCPPSILSLLGIVRHMTDVERVWFRRRVGGADVGYLYWTDRDPDADFTEVGTADAAECFAAFHDEWSHAESVTAKHQLDDLIVYQNKQGETLERNVRWIVTHMIEEYARHLGHCDLLRERVDGDTGY